MSMVNFSGCLVLLCFVSCIECKHRININLLEFGEVDKIYERVIFQNTKACACHTLESAGNKIFGHPLFVVVHLCSSVLLEIKYHSTKFLRQCFFFLLLK